MSKTVNSIRTVAIGSKLLSSHRWKTFHDFLFDYIRAFLGKEWMEQQGAAETNKRHLLYKWLEKASTFMRANTSLWGGIRRGPESGAIKGILDLSYSLYLTGHNNKLPERNRKRLLEATQFLDAMYELWVAGCMIRAGFSIEFEDEADCTRSHCEFTATYSKTGRKFSVEAKRRRATQTAERIGRNLKKALDKDVEHTRIIALEANIPSVVSNADLTEPLKNVLESLRERELKEPFADRIADPAYVVVTNTPYEHFPDTEIGRWAVAEGYKIPDFKFGAGFSTVRDMVNARDRHIEMFALMESLSLHDHIPITFDGEMPEMVFGETHPRLLIGEWYNLPLEGGGGEEAQLQFAEVIKERREAYCILRTKAGRNQLVSFPLTEDELAAYLRHPDTFFGRPSRNKRLGDPLDIYDFTLENYSKTPKSRLIELLNIPARRSELEAMSQKELCRLYAERITTEVLVHDSQKR